MTSTNDITGDSLNTRHATDKYKDNWDRIFNPPKMNRVKNVTLYSKIEDPSYDTYDILTPNGNLIGSMYKEVDGYFVFIFEKSIGGYLPERFFRYIAHRLAYLNEDWDAKVKEGL